MAFVVGVDLGQARDFSVIVINEAALAERVTLQQTPYQPNPGEVSRIPLVRHRIRHVERIPLGTGYPKVIDIVANRLRRLPPMPRPPRNWWWTPRAAAGPSWI